MHADQAPQPAQNATDPDGSERPGETGVPGTTKQEEEQSKQRRKADSTDWFASTLTRRFGLAGGLAWLGFLTCEQFLENVF